MSDNQLSQFRQSIDNIDAALIHMLAERFRITKAVGRHKAEVGMPPADPEREQEQIKRLRKLAEDAGLDPEFSEKFLRFVIDEVIHHHERIADESR
ncbi:MAG: chorismate mutase [Acidimicrobiales bacterium MED-G01]|nr:MAG: chorismate mutase [Acidimicrobiales bacterium MED-G01]|tara:strand:- start:260 stop:547 length:288 start_codon:yes stop_codon:yes gene_type:complete